MKNNQFVFSLFNWMLLLKCYKTYAVCKKKMIIDLFSHSFSLIHSLSNSLVYTKISYEKNCVRVGSRSSLRLLLIAYYIYFIFIFFLFSAPLALRTYRHLMCKRYVRMYKILRSRRSSLIAELQLVFSCFSHFVAMKKTLILLPCDTDTRASFIFVRKHRFDLTLCVKSVCVNTSTKRVFLWGRVRIFSKSFFFFSMDVRVPRLSSDGTKNVPALIIKHKSNDDLVEHSSIERPRLSVRTIDTNEKECRE